MSGYPLNVRSHYSLLESALSLENYVQWGQEKGIESLGLLDQDVLYGAIKFYQLAKDKGIQPLIGMLASVQGLANPEKTYQVALYPTNHSSYQDLLHLASLIKTENRPLKLTDLPDSMEDFLAILPIKEAEYRAYLDEGETMSKILKTYSDVFNQNNLFIGMSFQEAALDPSQYQTLAAEFDLPLIAFEEVRYGQSSDHLTYEVLQAIREGDKLDPNLLEEGKGGDLALQAPQNLQAYYEDQGFSKAWSQLEVFRSRIHLEIPFHSYRVPKYPVPPGQSAASYLRSLCLEGLEIKISSEGRDSYIKRMDHELDVIGQMGFPDYFLIVWDIISYARSQQIQTGPGRGSAAGSLVAYLLGITDVDPIAYDLLFERFLNPERSSPPDIDLDFPDDKRHIILAYIEKKYGSDQVAQIITFGRMGAKQALRDAGSVFNLKQEELSQFSKAIPNTPGISLKASYESSAKLRSLVQASPRNQELYKIALKLEGTPRNTSTHASGVIIADTPLENSTPLQVASSQLTQTQYEMDDLEALGLMKFDILGLRNLTIINDILDNLRAEGLDLKLEDIPLDDPKTLDLFRRADTEGIFQFESDGIQRVLKQLQPNSFEDIVAVNALYRPGPMDQISHYIDRKQGKEAVTYIHPDLEEILGLTYGILVYQEQVMRVTQKMAGFSLGEADIMRRTISKKDSQKMQEERQHFVAGAKARGYAEKDAQEVFDLIERFADYGFNRSHAVAYSKMAFQMAYLKAHYPGAFFAAILNHASSSKQKSYLLDIKAHGIEIKGPDINASLNKARAQGGQVRLGFDQIKGVPQDLSRALIKVREKKGPVEDFIQCLKQVPAQLLKERSIQALIQAGVFDSIHPNRGQLLESLEDIIENIKLSQGEEALLSIFDPIYKEADDVSLREKILQEKEVLPLAASPHPTEAYEDWRRLKQIPYLTELTGTTKNKVQSLASPYEIKKIQTKHGDTMAFLKVDDVFSEMEAVLFPETYRKYIQTLTKEKTYLIKGTCDAKKANLIVDQLERLEDSIPTLFLRLYTDQADWSALKTLIQRNPGQAPVIIHRPETKESFSLSGDLTVNPSEDLLEQLRTLLGDENVALVHKS